MNGLRRREGDGGSPAASNWYEAVAYCNWLSKQEGMPEAAWCYRPNSAGKYEAGMTIKPGFRNLKGYRLPTSFEWEYAARSGAVTSRFYGNDSKFLPQYAWYIDNVDAPLKPMPTGRLIPNSFGLFDVLGNVHEWCNETFYEDPCFSLSNWHNASVGGTADDSATRVMRGEGTDSVSSQLRCARRRWDRPPLYNHITVGFRISRTISPYTPGLAEIDAKIAKALAGEPAKDAVELLAFGRRSYDLGLFLQATHFFEAALRADTSISVREKGVSYDGACCAALANGLQGYDDPQPSDTMRTELRGKAFNWLTSELTIWHKFFEAANPGELSVLIRKMKHWQNDPDLASIRDLAAIEKLPEAERKEWHALWNRVHALQRDAEAKISSEEMPAN